MAEVAAPYNNAEQVTQSDTVSPAQPYTGIYIGAAGNLAFQTFGGQTVTLTGVLAGTVYRLGIKRVNATNTTIVNANLIGLW